MKDYLCHCKEEEDDDDDDEKCRKKNVARTANLIELSRNPKFCRCEKTVGK